MAEKYLEIIKEYLKYHYAGHFLAAFLFCGAAPLIVGIEALDPRRSAQVMEMYLSVIGIILLVPLFIPEQNKDIRDVVAVRKTPMLLHHMVRLLLGLMFLGIFVGVFLFWMHEGQCHFSFGKSYFGTMANCIFLGGLGIFFYGIADNLPAAYMVPMLYYVANYGSGRKYLGKFFLFSMTMGNSMEEKIWLLVGGICLSVLGIWWRNSGERLIASSQTGAGGRNR